MLTNVRRSIGNSLSKFILVERIPIYQVQTTLSQVARWMLARNSFL
jgi:hypothetical protein